MASTENQVQNLTEKLLTPFYEHIINREMFFKDVAQLIRQREKEINEQRQKQEDEEKRKRDFENELRKQEIEVEIENKRKIEI
jgi:Sec7-like guanine-nucleotide exchange factor